MATVDTKTLLVIHPGGLMPIRGGGSARLWAMIDHLRAIGYRIELVTKKMNANRAIGDRIDRVWETPETADAGAPAPFMAMRTPRDGVSDNCFDERRDRALELFAGQVAYRIRPLAAIAQYAWAARCLDRMPPGALRIIDTIDVQYNRAEQARDAGGDLSHIVCTREEEIRELRRAEALIAIQSKEALELKAMCPDRRVLTATHAQATRAAGSPAESRELLYTGNLYDPNVRGLETFLAQCWPSILVGIPGARLTVCGRVCEAFHDSYQGVRFEGFVQDLEPHYDRAAVVVNPIPYGTGLKIKTVDALSRGKALVATEPGVLGIPFDGDPPCRVSAMEGFTENILELMTSIPERRRLESAAVEYARRHFSADHVYRELTELLREHERTTQTTPPSAAAPKSTATQGADR